MKNTVENFVQVYLKKCIYIRAKRIEDSALNKQVVEVVVGGGGGARWEALQVIPFK